MARRKVGKRTEVKIDFASYSYLLNGIAGIGKTTLACETGMKLYGKDGFMLLTIGQEPKPDHIGGIIADRAKDWTELDEIIEDLVTYRHEDYSDLKLILVDSTDELFRLGEEETVIQFNSTVTVDKRVKSIKQAYGGFQGGENKTVDLVVNTIFKLREAGYGILFIGHTKQKNKKDIMTDIEFEQLTSNLDAKYYNAIKDKVNIVGCGYIEREMNDIETVKDAFSKKDKTVGRVASERRVIVFRDEEYAIDVKSHFEEIEPKIDFDTDSFVDAVMTAIKKQHEKFHGKSTEEELKVIKEQQQEEKMTVVVEEQVPDEALTETEFSEEVDPDFVDVDKNKELIKTITTHYKVATTEQKAEVKAILKTNGTTKFDPTLPTRVFVEILNLFK